MDSPSGQRSGVAGSSSLSDMPEDELRHYASELGLVIPRTAAAGELIRVVRERQELLLALDRDAMLDVVVWARRPVRQSASKEALAREIATVNRGGYEVLSMRGLRVLAALRGVAVKPTDSEKAIASRLRGHEGLW